MPSMKIISQLKISGRITNVILLLSSVLLFTECKRTSKDEVALGTGTPASSNFYVVNGPYGFVTPLKKSNGAALTSPTGSSIGAAVSLSKDSLYFVSKFSEVVSWNLTLQGQTSGATQVFSGVSDSLNLSNTLWTGNSNSVPFFVRNE